MRSSSTLIKKEKEHPSIQSNDLKYWDILNSLPVAVYICNPDGYVTNFNEAAAQLWGRRPVIGQDRWSGCGKIYNPDGSLLQPNESPMAEVLRVGKALSEREIIIERPNGERCPVMVHPRPLFDENNVLIGALNTLVDLTNVTQTRSLLKQTEDLRTTIEDLKRSEDRYHRMIAEVQDYAIILLSKDGIIQNWNQGAEQIKGYQENEILGKSFRIFYTKEDQRTGLPESLIQRAEKEGRARHEGWRVRKDGTKFWGSISITALHDDNGKVFGFSKVTRDLTEQKMQEDRAAIFAEESARKNELLRESEERYHRMISEVEDYAILLLDSNGYIQNWNKGAEKIKGYKAEEIIGQHFSVFYPEEALATNLPGKLLAEATRQGKALHEGWRVRKDGSAFWGSVVLTALHDTDDSLIGFSKVTRDLTERKITEEKLLASSHSLQQKNSELEKMNEDLSSFAYISSHDLQEPLRKIQTFSDRIIELEYNNLSDKGKDLLQRMQAGALRMQTLIRDILAYSRTTTSDKVYESTDLNELLAQSKIEMEVMMMEKKAIVESAPLPRLKVIPFQIQQLFNNLLNNAMKFSKDGIPPHIRVTSEIVQSNSVQPPLNDPGKKYYHIAFSDNGIGFDPVYEKKIFEVFQRLHGRSEYGGTGIGLAICKKIVENHRGILRAEGHPGEGAILHIYLPVTA